MMIINRSGITIRLAVAELRVLGRATQGVKLINLRSKDSIASITKVTAEPEEAVAEEENADMPAEENIAGEQPIEEKGEE